MRVIIAFVFTLALVSSALAADVDWKMYVGATADAPSFCFYDANGVTIAHDGYVRVWTKCLHKVDLESEFFKGDRGRQIVDNAAKKVNDGYVPPIVAIGTMSVKQSVDVIAYEESANLGDSDERARFSLELNCSARMQRSLGSYVKASDRAGFVPKPGDWSAYRQRARKLTCKKSCARSSKLAQEERFTRERQSFYRVALPRRRKGSLSFCGAKCRC